ncbi:MAG: flagellar export protein FliJ [Magnetococcales bacterium]|nr:flagellar export protein FliJ [Magnetococcales bacterium]
MNRFSRLKELRKLKEDAAGQALARIHAQIETLRQRIVDLERETMEEKEAATEALAGPRRPDPHLLASFLKGQEWRRGRLESALKKARQEADEARDVWHHARMQLKQVEILADKENLRMKQEQLRVERKEMDLVGIYRTARHQDNQQQARRGSA